MEEVYLKQLLKKHLYLTKKEKDPFLILDYNRFNPLAELVENDQLFTIEHYLVALSLQSYEKYTGITNNISFFSMTFDEPYEEFSIITDNHAIILQRYNIITPLNYTYSPFERQIYCLQFPKTEEIYYFCYKNVYFTKDSILLKNKDIKFKLTLKENELHVQKEDEYYDFHLSDQIYNEYPSILQIEKITQKSKVHRIKENGFFEHKIFQCNKGIINNIIYNLTYLTKSEEKEPIASFFFQFSNDHCIYIEKETIQCRILEKENYLPTLWKINHQQDVYYLEITNDSYFYTINKFEPIYIIKYEIINRNNNKRQGFAWIKYVNYFPEKDIIQKKLQFLFRPLQRPSYEHFMPQKLPFEAVIPSLLILFITLITIIIIIIITCLYFLDHFHLFQFPLVSHKKLD